ncbi:15-hydroxyprostaglandin dehydrogenase [NAD+] [Harpegnathos saltator]|uniref:15-hydroxyprostaglandin dehydrogenase [NAD(+)] n=1 Tax=Harpegnathos saltator TaxID=610380 RepID=E2C5E8_HARSA|nr:15-hydroxyprostaglandin dehydrogenase [NAD+] [Harpegnathos saltator]
MDNVQDKTVMITGGAGGLGSEFIKIVLENSAKKVAVVDLPTSQVKEYEETFKKIVDAFGYFDILVNNAGKLNDNKLEQMIDLNTTLLIRSSLLAIEYMGKHKGGKGGLIINIASVAGLSASYIVPICSATKHAVVGLSQTVAYCYHNTGVRIVTLCPGFTATSIVISSLDNVVLDFVKPKISEKYAPFGPAQAKDNVSRALLHLTCLCIYI